MNFVDINIVFIMGKCPLGGGGSFGTTYYLCPHFQDARSTWMWRRGKKESKVLLSIGALKFVLLLKQDEALLLTGTGLQQPQQ